MKQIKILHLFPRLLSLYGEYGNVAVLKAMLMQNGYTVTVTECEDGSADYKDFSFVYVGSGTEDNLMVALERLLPNAEAVRASIESGTLWLATGNAMALFGQTVTRQTEVSAVGAFAYQTKIDDAKRYLGDVLTTEPATLGFINTSCVYTGIETPLLELYLNKTLGNDKKSPAEGIREKNFFGTQLIGPFLVKNPHYLKEIYSLLTGEDLTIDPQSNMARAYQVALTELRTRAGLAE